MVKCAFKQYKSTFKQYLEEKGECPFIAPHPKFGAKEGHLNILVTCRIMWSRDKTFESYSSHRRISQSYFRSKFLMYWERLKYLCPAMPLSCNRPQLSGCPVWILEDLRRINHKENKLAGGQGGRRSPCGVQGQNSWWGSRGWSPREAPGYQKGSETTKMDTI